jgi:sugar lactone lactonase YvrE
MTRHRDMNSRVNRRALALGAWVALGVATPEAALPAAQASFLDGVHRQTVLSSTVPDNGDQNPYAIVVAPVSAGSVQKDDVLITNFNDAGNLQGLGTTIVNYNPTTKKLATFAALPRDLAGCPGGIGLSTAMTMLKSGWVIVGSAPSADGTTGTRGAGCLVVLDSNGKVASIISGDKIDMPWGNMAVIDNGDSATIFVSNAGFGVGPPEGDPRVVNQATVLRIKLSVPEGKPPTVVDQTVVGSGFGSQPNKDVFLIGPTGLALGPNDTLYVSDATGNRISAIWDATTRDHSAGVGRTVTKDGLLQTPLAMATAPNGHLLVVNAKNGQVVEIDPVSGEQIKSRWIDPNKAQKPPGSGDLFGIAMTPAGDGFYFVKDEDNTLAIAK